VSDGDRVTLITWDGTKFRVRLYGIDAPEVRHDGKPGQPFGEEAKRALAGKVLRKEVTITIQDKDQYKRVVGIIKIGNRNINEEMIRVGVQGISAWPVCQRVHQRREESEREEAWVMATVQPAAAVGVQGCPAWTIDE